jgi:hypothetical protein
VEAHPAVLFCSGWRSARQKRTPPCFWALAAMAALQKQKRTPPCCCVLAVMALCGGAPVLLCSGCIELTRRALRGSAPRRAVLLWLTQRPAKACAVVLLRHG